MSSPDRPGKSNPELVVRRTPRPSEDPMEQLDKLTQEMDKDMSHSGSSQQLGLLAYTPPPEKSNHDLALGFLKETVASVKRTVDGGKQRRVVKQASFAYYDKRHGRTINLGLAITYEPDILEIDPQHPGFLRYTEVFRHLQCTPGDVAQQILDDVYSACAPMSLTVTLNSSSKSEVQFQIVLKHTDQED